MTKYEEKQQILTFEQLEPANVENVEKWLKRQFLK